MFDPVIKDLLCKCRLDKMINIEHIIIDLKSCMDARKAPFQKVAFDKGYHIQAAWYLYGVTQLTKVEHNDFRIIAVEKAPPYGVNVFRMDEEAIQEGLIQCNKAVELYADAVKNDKWPCYPPGIQDVGLPGWVRCRNEHAIHE